MAPGETLYGRMTWKRAVLHADMNAYFASIEQNGNPLLRGKPVLVVADSRRRSVVMTASYEARAFGVKTGMNLYEGRKLCPQAVIVDGNSEKYLHFTARILKVLESFSDQVEMISCDEAYLDVTHSLKFFRTGVEGIARMVQGKIREATGLPCSVGAAENKLLAKLASEMRKPNGLTVIGPEEAEKILEKTPVEDLCGIGSRLAQKLNRLGIHTCKQLGGSSLGFLQQNFGFWGYWLKRMGQGLDDSPVRKLTDPEEVKSVGHSTTFPRDTSDMEVLKGYLLLLSEKVAARLRQGACQGRTVSLYVRFKDFTSFSRQKTLKEHSDDGYKIYRTALGLLENAKPFPQPTRLLGISVSSLTPTQWQHLLLENYNEGAVPTINFIKRKGLEYLFRALGAKRRLNETVDQLNRKFGALTVKPARIVYAERFGILGAPIPPSQHRF